MIMIMIMIMISCSNKLTACHSRISINNIDKIRNTRTKENTKLTSFRVPGICPEHSNFYNIFKKTNQLFNQIYFKKYERFAVNSVDRLFLAPLLPIIVAVYQKV